jgi:hypothetical protein
MKTVEDYFETKLAEFVEDSHGKLPPVSGPQGPIIRRMIALAAESAFIDGFMARDNYYKECQTDA